MPNLDGALEALITRLAEFLGGFGADVAVPRAEIYPLTATGRELKLPSVRYEFYGVQPKGSRWGHNPQHVSNSLVKKGVKLEEGETTFMPLFADQLVDIEKDFSLIPPFSFVQAPGGAKLAQILAVEAPDTLQLDKQGYFIQPGEAYEIYEALVEKWYDMPEIYAMQWTVLHHTRFKAHQLASKVSDFFHVTEQADEALRPFSMHVDEVGMWSDQEQPDRANRVIYRKDIRVSLLSDDLVTQDTKHIGETDLETETV